MEQNEGPTQPKKMKPTAEVFFAEIDILLERFLTSLENKLKHKEHHPDVDWEKVRKRLRGGIILIQYDWFRK